MPKKVIVKKKKVVKKKQIPIIPRQLPRTKCCEDYKTGSAFTIPLGFSDRLGTNRLPQTSHVTNIYYQQPSVKQNGINIQTQTESDIPINLNYKPLEKGLLSPFYPSHISVLESGKKVTFEPQQLFNESELNITNESSIPENVALRVVNTPTSAKRNGFKSPKNVRNENNLEPTAAPNPKRRGRTYRETYTALLLQSGVEPNNAIALGQTTSQKQLKGKIKELKAELEKLK